MSDYLPGETPALEPDLKKGRRKRAGFSDAPTKIDRLPPHAPEAEQGVLACCLMDPRTCIGECVEKFHAGAEVFYDLRHQTIYETLVEMYESREAVDLITLQQRLKNKQRLEEVGGLAYLSYLPDAVPSAANMVYYTDIVMEKYILRRVVYTCTEVVGRVYEHAGDVDSLLDEVERDVLAIGEKARKRKTCESMQEPVKRVIQRIEEYHERHGELTGIGSGLTDFDKMTGGLQNGDMIVIAARPSMGKTSLALNIVEHAAVDCKLPVGVFSLEMMTDALVERMLCSRARVNIRNVKEGFLAERDYPKITNASGKLSVAPIYIDDEAGISIGTLRAKARRMYQSYGIKLFVIDYLQLLHATIGGKRIEKREREVAEISGGIKALAKELKVPIIVISQLNRELDKYKGRKPTLSDLRESGAIEQDADVVGMLYKPSRHKDEEDDDQDLEVIAVNLNIAKQRNGPTGDVHLTFLKSYTRFESAARVSDNDVPTSDAQAEFI